MRVSRLYYVGYYVSGGSVILGRVCDISATGKAPIPPHVKHFNLNCWLSGQKSWTQDDTYINILAYYYSNTNTATVRL